MTEGATRAVAAMRSWSASLRGGAARCLLAVIALAFVASPAYASSPGTALGQAALPTPSVLPAPTPKPTPLPAVAPSEEDAQAAADEAAWQAYLAEARPQPKVLGFAVRAWLFGHELTGWVALCSDPDVPGDRTGWSYRRWGPRVDSLASRDAAGRSAWCVQYAYVRGNPLWWTDPTGLAADLDRQERDLRNAQRTAELNAERDRQRGMVLSGADIEAVYQAQGEGGVYGLLNGGANQEQREGVVNAAYATLDARQAALMRLVNTDPSVIRREREEAFQRGLLEVGSWVAGGIVGKVLKGVLAAEAVGADIAAIGTRAGNRVVASTLPVVGSRSVTISQYQNIWRAFEQQERVIATTIAGGSDPAALATAVDINTGKLATSTNGAVPAIVAPELRAYADVMGGLGNHNGVNTVGRCAEFRAGNELMVGGSRLDDIYVTPAWRNNAQGFVCRCANCMIIYGR